MQYPRTVLYMFIYLIKLNYLAAATFATIGLVTLMLMLWYSRDLGKEPKGYVQKPWFKRVFPVYKSISFIYKFSLGAKYYAGKEFFDFACDVFFVSGSGIWMESAFARNGYPVAAIIQVALLTVRAVLYVFAVVYKIQILYLQNIEM